MAGQQELGINSCKRGVAPVIATILLIAIAVVGGTIIFTFTEGFFSAAQISGISHVVLITIEGYDARTVTELIAHNGIDMTPGSGGNNNSIKEFDERVAIYLRSDSPNTITIEEISFGGTVYNYTTISGNAITNWNEVVDLTPGKYSILTKAPDSILPLEAPRIQAGQSVTLLIDLDTDLRAGRTAQFKMTTNTGAIFVGTINIGQHNG